MKGGREEYVIGGGLLHQIAMISAQPRIRWNGLTMRPSVADLPMLVTPKQAARKCATGRLRLKFACLIRTGKLAQHPDRLACDDPAQPPLPRFTADNR